MLFLALYYHISHSIHLFRGVIDEKSNKNGANTTLKPVDIFFRQVRVPERSISIMGGI
ncbi:uncharacterized protein PHALS_00007 [Plasmopara halstedii]|uniref:Uncharacterized protein n=1 Tax=Plasmopara halstedii TaxID=4781 RepID=A0A0P1A5N1_PLAHL|nr:uncharacterized protein PHALS_00007 [Plasmopara halstedii]CEG35685.1 hypothetical protein PHALS_00007 [Plasmopara halstedii]|eukprot:XP_024572054.1 hypothetical protein PHALS_00007 [Plasmopara halstedii]